MGNLPTDTEHPIKFTEIDDGFNLDFEATVEQSSQSSSFLNFFTRMRV